MRYWLGVDFGQANDWTALTVMERVLPIGNERVFSQLQNSLRSENGEFSCRNENVAEVKPVQNLAQVPELHIPYLSRPPLRTSYEKIARGVVDRLCKLAPVGAFGERDDIGLVVDATGVGRAVVDMLDGELRRRRDAPRVHFWPVTVTGGNRVTRQGAYLAVPKRNLITAGVVALQSGRLKIGASVENRDVLIQELRDYRLKINLRGHDQYEPWREGAHDDLLFSMCLAAWAWSFQETTEKIGA